MSRDLTPEELAEWEVAKAKIQKKDVTHRPVCPECGKQTIVIFTPPKSYLYPKDGTVHPDSYKLIHTPEYVDWERAHIYCCNASTNCKIDTRIMDLS
jgi:hypothetical protein